MKSKIGCGKPMKAGDYAASRFGTYICKTCDDATPAPFMAIYTSGILRYDGMLRCGETVQQSSERNARGAD